MHTSTRPENFKNEQKILRKDTNFKQLKSTQHIWAQHLTASGS